MSEQIGFLLLCVGVFNGGLITILLLGRRQVSSANLILCFFILLLLMRTLVYLVGKESIFDPYSWLYVPPIDISLAYGPCIYLFIFYSCSRSFKPQDTLHFLPAIIQIAYYICLLHIDKSTINNWLTSYHIPYFSVLETFLVICSMGIYLGVTIALYVRYQRWLDRNVSDAENYRLTWLKLFLWSSALFLGVWMLSAIYQFAVDANYENSFLLYISQSLLLCLLSFESWRNADLTLPKITVQKHLKSFDAMHQNSALFERGGEWINEIIKNEWWKDPELSLKVLAAKLGTNSTTLSAAINASANNNFNSVINKLRVEYVCHQILNQLNAPADPKSSLTQLASDAGFNSKNSFNRNFKKFVGVSPTHFCQQQKALKQDNIKDNI
jgi:AraC-like DNA-binding protein